MPQRKESTIPTRENDPLLRTRNWGRPANDPVNALGRMMHRRRLRPSDLAALSGISGRKLYNLLNNRTYPSELDILALARALECHPDDIRSPT